MYYLKGQKHFDDCGVAVVATILGLYGIEYNYKSLGNIRSFLDILVTLESYNFKVKAVETKVINTFPCIIQIRKLKHNHFVVIYEEKDNVYTYYSPNKLLVHKIRRDKLQKYFTHKAIYIYSDDDYNEYKFNIKSIPYSIKLIIFDVITLILIYNILTTML